MSIIQTQDTVRKAPGMTSTQADVTDANLISFINYLQDTNEKLRMNMALTLRNDYQQILFAIKLGIEKLDNEFSSNDTLSKKQKKHFNKRIALLQQTISSTYGRMDEEVRELWPVVDYCDFIENLQCQFESLTNKTDCACQFYSEINGAKLDDGLQATVTLIFQDVLNMLTNGGSKKLLISTTVDQFKNLLINILDNSKNKIIDLKSVHFALIQRQLSNHQCELNVDLNKRGTLISIKIPHSLCQYQIKAA